MRGGSVGVFVFKKIRKGILVKENSILILKRKVRCPFRFNCGGIPRNPLPLFYINRRSDTSWSSRGFLLYSFVENLGLLIPALLVGNLVFICSKLKPLFNTRSLFFPSNETDC